MMRRRQHGFTLVEVMITLVVLLLVMGAASTFFLGTLQTYKQQSRLAQSGMDSIIGLEILRRDVEHAGYGLPWNNLTAYSEAASGILNDSGNPPRGIVSVNNPPSTLNNSDYLVIKASNVAMNAACKKWTTLQAGDVKRDWTTVPANAENLNSTDRVVVMAPGNTGTNWRSLVVAGTFSTTYNATAGFAPANASEARVIYGIDGPDSGGNPLRMPFNRADYFIDTSSVPQHCAPNTGVLVKRVVMQTGGTLDTALPLLDCVASMHVQYLLDTNGDGAVDTTSDDISALTAAEIRDQLRQVRVSLLAHEGQRDPTYTHSPTTISVAGNAVDISANRNYRWRVYTLAVTTENLRN